MKGDRAHLSMGAAVASTLHDWIRGRSDGHITSLGVFSDGQPSTSYITFSVCHHRHHHPHHFIRS